jgi:hypothetical protein
MAQAEKAQPWERLYHHAEDRAGVRQLRCCLIGLGLRRSGPFEEIPHSLAEDLTKISPATHQKARELGGRQAKLYHLCAGFDHGRSSAGAARA